MRTIQMTLDDDLVIAVDRVSKELQTSRSAFARKALRDALARYSLEQLERKHRRGYAHRTLLRSCAGDCADGTEDDCPEKDCLIQHLQGDQHATT